VGLVTGVFASSSSSMERSLTSKGSISASTLFL
jgi:hypothetical protein